METQTLLISLLIILSVVGAVYWAYQEGYLDPIIQEVGVYLFKAKAMAEKKRLQAQGMKAGQDFADCKCCPCHSARPWEEKRANPECGLTSGCSATEGCAASRRGQDGCRCNWWTEEAVVTCRPHLGSRVRKGGVVAHDAALATTTTSPSGGLLCRGVQVEFVYEQPSECIFLMGFFSCEG